jgi:hypothetical protein
MHQRTVHRFAAALALSAILALAGARPASAENFGIFERGVRWLSALLDMPLVRQAPESQALPSSLSKSGAPAPGETVVPDGKGLGVDPNGAP